MAKILIVDDETDVVTLIKFLLEKDGHQVTAARHGGEAMAVLGVEPADPAAPMPELIIMDMLMPVMDGLTACGRLAAHGRAAGVPVVVLSAKGALRENFEKHHNVKGFVDKPFDPKRLRDVIESILGPQAPRG